MVKIKRYFFRNRKLRLFKYDYKSSLVRETGLWIDKWNRQKLSDYTSASLGALKCQQWCPC